MSVYKEPIDWLRQSIDSILSQTFDDFEYLIICDNPAYKEMIELLKDYAGKNNHIRLIFNEENIGLTKSLNKGLAVAKGEYIARMDADDISLPTRFDEQVSYLDSHPNCIVCGSKVKYFGESVRWWKRPKSDWIKVEDEQNKGRLIIGSCFAHPAVMMRRTTPQFFYDESVRRSQDYELWTRVVGLGTFHNIPKVLLNYRVSLTQISSKSHNQYALEIRRKYLRKRLSDCGMDFLLSEEGLTPECLYGNLKLLKNNQSLSESEKKSITLLVYFSQMNNRKSTFLKSILSGDFWGFPYMEKFRYFMIVAGIREPMKI